VNEDPEQQVLVGVDDTQGPPDGGVKTLSKIQSVKLSEVPVNKGGQAEPPQLFAYDGSSYCNLHLSAKYK